MAKQQFLPIEQWEALTLNNQAPIENLLESNENFTDFQNKLKEYQAGKPGTPKTLGIDILKEYLQKIAYIPHADHLILDSQHQFSSQNEINIFNYNNQVEENLSKKNRIQQPKLLCQAYLRSELIKVIINEFDFMYHNGELMMPGIYNFIYTYNTGWMLNYNKVDITTYGINIDLNNGTLFENDMIVAKLEYDLDMTNVYIEILGISNLSQIENDGESSSSGKYVNYRDIIIINNTQISRIRNSDKEYSSKYMYKGMVYLSNYLWPYEIDIADLYTAKITFSQSTSAFCAPICNIERNTNGEPYISFYTNYETNFTIPSIILINSNLVDLPFEYEQVQYLKSTGEQYIKLENINTNGFTMELLGNLSSWDSGSEQSYSTLAGGSTGTHKSAVMINALNGKFALNIDDIIVESTDISSQNIQCTIRSTILSGSNSLYADGSNVITSSKTYIEESSPNSIYFCANNNNGVAEQLCSLKCYNVKFYSKDMSELVYNLVPCYRKSDFKPGFYDLKNNIFLINQGVGKDFVIGSDKGLSDYIISGNGAPTQNTTMSPGLIYKDLTAIDSNSQYYICSYSEQGYMKWNPSMINYCYKIKEEY